MVVAVLAIGLLSMALVGDFVLAFNPLGRLGLHGRTTGLEQQQQQRLTLHRETVPVAR